MDYGSIHYQLVTAYLIIDGQTLKNRPLLISRGVQQGFLLLQFSMAQLKKNGLCLILVFPKTDPWFSMVFLVLTFFHLADSNPLSVQLLPCVLN